MYSKAKIAGHPIHPMLVAFPIVFYLSTLVAFCVYQFGSQSTFAFQFGYVTNMAGVAFGVLAAIPGFIDWAVGIPNDSAAKSRGLMHMILNVVTLLLFTWSAVRIYGDFSSPPNDLRFELVLTLIGVGAMFPAMYHGFELIATHKVGVALTPEQEAIEPTRAMKRKDHETTWT